MGTSRVEASKSRPFHQAAEKTGSCATISGRSRLRPSAKVTTSVSSASATASVMSRITSAISGCPFSFRILNEKAASCAVSREPSWKRAWGRSRKR